MTKRYTLHEELLKEANEQLKKQLDGITTTNYHLSEENLQLKHKNNQQEKIIDRLIKIITDEHYN